MIAPIPRDLLALLRCPDTGAGLIQTGDRLATADGQRRYSMTPSGIPLFGEAGLSPEAEIQKQHYERIAGRYTENLGQAHTQEYFAYLDRRFLALVGDAPLDAVAEICCGTGEAFHLLGDRARRGVGVDVSTSMLERARMAFPGGDRLFVQGDAVRLPLADRSFDAVFLLGGIHHVNNRAALFAEAHRILEPRGRLFWREPVDDFLPWRLARQVIYRHCGTLEAETERPLRYASTAEHLRAAGFVLEAWQSLGFIGYSLLMNGDVLAVNRVWGRLPGARALTRAATRFDELALRLPGLRRAGALAIGAATARG